MAIMSNGMRLDATGALLSFYGRIGRLAFFGYNLLVGLYALPLVYFSISTAGNDRTRLVGAISAMAFVLALPALWAFAALLSKRLHDLNRSAWHGLWLPALWIVPWDLLSDPLSHVIDAVLAVALIGLLALPGPPTPNAYGAAAK